MGQKRELGMLSGCKVTGAVWKGQRDLGEEGTGRTPAPGAAVALSSLTGVVPAREIGELHAWLSHKKIMQNIQLLPAAFRNCKTLGFLLGNKGRELVLKQ